METGGKPARLGLVFHEKIEEVKDKRLLKTIKLKTCKDRISTEKLTNLIVKHKLWPEIEEDIINATEEEVKKHGE